MELLIITAMTSIGMTRNEALYGRRCGTLVCWSDMGANKLLGPEMVKR